MEMFKMESAVEMSERMWGNVDKLLGRGMLASSLLSCKSWFTMDCKSV